jgi:hypothetical protein
MEFDDIVRLKGEPSLPFPISQRNRKWGKVIINHKIAIPISSISSSYDQSLDISIVDDAKNEIGVICFTKNLGNTPINQLTENRFIAFLNESKVYCGSYEFEKDYLLIKDSFYQKFIQDSERTSSIWGGFVTDNYSKYISGPIKISLSEIRLIENLDFPNEYFIGKSIRAIVEPYAFERYLKFYHLLELIFDFNTIERIKKLDIETESTEIGKLLLRYKRDDIDRLKEIIKMGIKDIARLENALNRVGPYLTIAEEMFYDYGKESNPIPHFNNLQRIITMGGFSAANGSAVGLGIDYKGSICNLAAYWIYRVRSSIVHSKIGEYLLLTTDENFVVDFAEPLLLEVIKQCFQKPTP